VRVAREHRQERRLRPIRRQRLAVLRARLTAREREDERRGNRRRPRAAPSVLRAHPAQSTWIPGPRATADIQRRVDYIETCMAASAPASTSAFVETYLRQTAEIALATSREDLARVIDLLFEAYQNDRTIFTCGNGG